MQGQRLARLFEQLNKKNTIKYGHLSRRAIGRNMRAGLGARRARCGSALDGGRIFRSICLVISRNDIAFGGPKGQALAALRRLKPALSPNSRLRARLGFDDLIVSGEGAPETNRKRVQTRESHMQTSVRKTWSKRVGGALALFAGIALTAFANGPAAAQSKQLTLCWAAWDPANALVELGKDFTKETGIEMKYEFVPWTSYADRFLNELNSHGKLCDMIIGDSQWIGGAAENHWYVKLNDFFAKEHISMDDFVPATVVGYSEWPKNTPNYWALPAMADAVGWTYRKDWFARPEIQAEFKKKYGRDLAPPKTYGELQQDAEFFQGREIDGKKVYGAYIFTERGSEGITMGVTNVLYNYGFEYENPKKPYQMQGFVNSPDAVKGLEFYKELYKCCTAPGLTNAYMQEGLDAFKSGQVAMQMNWFAFFPGLYKDPNVGGDKIGFFVNPAGPKGHFTQLGGQGISVVATSDHQDDALRYIKWFAQPKVQQKWWEIGGYSALKAVVDAPGFPKSAPFAPQFLESMAIVKDFWAEPSYAQLMLDMQKRVHDYVVADKGTAQQALDLLVKDWTKVFKEQGKQVATQ
jgi:multiple sugar transport system substrate-binding protein